LVVLDLLLDSEEIDIERLSTLNHGQLTWQKCSTWNTEANAPRDNTGRRCKGESVAWTEPRDRTGNLSFHVEQNL